MDLKEQIIAEYLTQGGGFSCRADTAIIPALRQASNVRRNYINLDYKNTTGSFLGCDNWTEA